MVTVEEIEKLVGVLRTFKVEIVEDSDQYQWKQLRLASYLLGEESDPSLYLFFERLESGRDSKFLVATHRARAMVMPLECGYCGAHVWLLDSIPLSLPVYSVDQPPHPWWLAVVCCAEAAS